MRLILTAVLLSCCLAGIHGQKAKASSFLKDFESEVLVLTRKWRENNWKFMTDMTKENRQKYQEGTTAETEWFLEKRRQAMRIKLKGLDPSEVRQLKLLILSKPYSKNKTRNDETHEVISKLQQIHGNAKVPMNPKFIKMINTTEDLARIDVEKIQFGSSKDPMELLYVWDQYWKATGGKMPKLYEKMIKLQNIAAKERGYKDMGDYYRKGVYEVDNLEEIVDKLWSELKPLHEEVHAYIRFRLSQTYPNLVKDGEMIPAHLTGTFQFIKAYGK